MVYQKGVAVLEQLKELEPNNIERSIEAVGLLANFIPCVGGLLSGVVLSTTSSRRWTRLLNFLDTIESRLRGVEGLSEDQEEIVVEVVERVVRERSDEKVLCYRNLLLNGLSDRDLDYDMTLEMVKLVERLTTNHIKVLQVINDPVGAKANLGSGGYLERPAQSLVGLQVGQIGVFFMSAFFPNWPCGQLGRIWEELCDAHILLRISPQITKPPPHQMIGMDVIVEAFAQHITDFGRDFIRYILTSDPDQS